MSAKTSLTLLASALALAIAPMTAAAQETSPDARDSEGVSATQPATDATASAAAGPVTAALRLSSEHAALLAPPVLEPPSSDDLRQLDERAPTAPVAAPSKGSGSGLGFMIGGAAAFVGGLLIGGTGGNLIAAGGVALGVYGAIIYF